MTSKKDANYRIAKADDKNSCGSCDNFTPPDKCKVVSGTISAAGLCDLFTPVQTQQGEQGTDSLMAQLFGNTKEGN